MKDKWEEKDATKKHGTEKDGSGEDKGADEKGDGENGDDENGDDENGDDETVRTVIDFEGIAQRVEAIPVSRGNYRNLSAGDAAIFYLNKDDGDFNRFEFRASGSRDLVRYSLAEL